MGIVIVTKSLEAKGGVSNFYREISSISTGIVDLDFIEAGTPTKYYYSSGLLKLLIYPWNIFVTAYKILMCNHAKVILNPSTTYTCIIRDLLLLVVCKLSKKQVVVFFRGWREFMFEKRAFRLLCSLLITYSDSQLVLAESFKLTLQRLFNAEKISVIYTGIPKKSFLVNVGKQKEKVILFMSRISYDKGIHLFLEALLTREAFLAGEGYRVVIAGHPKNQDVAYYLARTLKRFSHLNIKYVGFVRGHDRENLLQKAKLLVLPSRFEGCPNIIVEALAYKCHVLASKVGAIPEILQESSHGHLISDLTIEEVIKSLDELLKNKKIEIKPSLSDKFEQNFILENILNRLIQA
jgi:glycosyltransferase involved in cell wall biosynthesis